MQFRNSRAPGRVFGLNIAVAISCVTLAAALSSCGTTPSPVDFDSATLHGVIVDEGHNPVQWAAVSIEGRRPVYTDIQGRFAVTDVPRRLITIQAQRDGFESHTGEFLFSNRTQVLYLQFRSGRFYVQRAIEALDSGDDRAAVELAERSLELLPGDPEAQFVAALAAYRTGDVAAAQSHLAAFSDRHHYEAVILFRSGLTMSEAGEQ